MPPRKLAAPRFSPLTLMLVFVPLAVLAERLHWGGPAVFTCSALAIVPLAGRMGEATERLGAHLGAGAGGLLNATFGNAAELILALVALRSGHLEVVKASLTGSIIGNALLVLGLAMLVGGARRERQRFDRAAAGAAATTLTLAAVGLLVPAAFHLVNTAGVQSAALAAARMSHEHGLSLLIAAVLFVAYGLSLVFSLGTHRHLYAGVPLEGEAPPGGVRGPLLALGVSTLLVAGMSELLVGAVQETSRAFGFSEVFVGVIVVAVVGNAAEHSTAVLMALRNRMDLALHIAIGSSVQIALFVAPLLVFASRFLGPHPLDLVFTPFEVLAVIAAVGVVQVVAQDGESNWFEGVLLLAVYGILAVAFFHLP